MISVSVTQTGGWRGKIDGDWITLPISVRTLRPPVVGSVCALGLNASPISGENTYDFSITSLSEYEATSEDLGVWECCECTTGDALDCFDMSVTRTAARERQERGTLYLLPDLDKSVNRMVEKDYGAFVFRGGMPKAQEVATQMCCRLYYDDCDAPGEGCPNFSSSLRTTHTRRDEQWAWVQDADHEIELPFAETTYAPYTQQSVANRLTELEQTIHGPGICPNDEFGDPGTPLCCFDSLNYRDYRQISVNFPNVDTTSSGGGNPDLMDFLYHDEHIARYVNYCAHPHFSYFYFAPPDSDTEYWLLSGSKETWSDYWGKLREQYSDYSELPGPERFKTRNTCFSPALLEAPAGRQTFIKDYCMGVETSWWGNCGFKAVNPTVPASKTLDSSSSAAWSGTNCTIAHGANMVLTPSAGVISLSYDMGQWASSPYMYAHIAKQIAVSWNVSNIDSISWYLVSQQGDEVLLATTQGTFDRPSFDDDFYAGSWAQNFGVGVIADTGSDDLGNGVSAATVLALEQSFAFGLLKGFTGVTLRADIDVTNPAVTVTINYPTFYVGTDDAAVLVECGMANVCLWANGPGVRIGTWDCWDSGGSDVFSGTPIIREPGAKMTALDALIYQRLVFEAKSKTDNLNTQIAALYDSVEGQTRAKVRSGTVGYMAAGGNGGALLLQNGLDVPPLACWPLFARDAGTYQQEDTPAQEAWALDVEARYYISPGSQIDLEDDESPRVRWTTADATLVPASWCLTKHKKRVDNDEGVTFHIVRDPDGDFATASPYHGYFAVIGGIPQTGEGPSYDVSLAGRHLRTYIAGGTVWLGKATNVEPRAWQDVDTGIAATRARVRLRKFGSDQTLCLLYVASNDLKFRTSTNEGTSFSVATSIATASDGDFVVSRHGVLYFYWIDGSGALKGKIYDAQMNVLEATFTVVASGVDDEGLAVRDYFVGGTSWGIGILYGDSGTLTYITSDDGITFS